MGGGGPFSTCTNFFSKCFAVLVIFFFNNPLLEFYFFPKNCFPDSIFSGQIKKGRKNFFGTNISLVKV